MHGVEVLPLICWSGRRHLVAVAVIDARPLIRMMQGVELVPMAGSAAADPADDLERMP